MKITHIHEKNVSILFLTQHECDLGSLSSLYFPKNLEDIKDHFQVCNFFPIKDSFFFLRKHELIANPFILQ